MADLAFRPVNLTELADEGVLMAANEGFFWPLGLALTWTRDDDGAASDLHVPGTRERIDTDEDETALERRTRFAAWFEQRLSEMLPEEAAEARRRVSPVAPSDVGGEHA